MAPPAPTSAPTPAPTWTCPYCPLLCDSLQMPAPDAAGLRPLGTDCPRALRALADLAPAASPPALLNGQPVPLGTALAAAAQALRNSRQPLFAGLGSDVAAQRVLVSLAQHTGAVCDAINGRAFFDAVRALQDRGAYNTTLAEVRNRADLIVCFGGSPRARLPEIWRRLGLGDDLVAARHVVFIGGDADALAELHGLNGITAEALALQGDLFDTAALLAAAVAGRPAPAPLQALAQALQAASYAVILWEGGQLPMHGGLLIEMLNRVVGLLNRKTRAAALPLGGGDGAATANQVQTWLTGLPLRARTTAAGIEHEPLCFDGQALLADGAVDALLWLQAFDGHAVPPATPGLPRIVIGPAAMAPRLPAHDGTDVFVAVATPGIGSDGHLFRTDGVVLMPLHKVADQGLPTPADVVRQLHEQLRALP